LTALKTLRSHLPASIPIIGCGGISTGADALEFAQAGASLVQVYTSFGYDGAGTCRRIKDELSDLLAKENTTWGSVVEQATATLSFKEPSAKKSSVGLLIEEANELSRLLDKLGESLGADVADVLVPPTTS
jgi:dihydroorotate dehydrogenase